MTKIKKKSESAYMILSLICSLGLLSIILSALVSFTIVSKKILKNTKKTELIWNSHRFNLWNNLDKSNCKNLKMDSNLILKECNIESDTQKITIVDIK